MVASDIDQGKSFFMNKRRFDDDLVTNIFINYYENHPKNFLHLTQSS